jgi:hypothetical protein
MSFCTSENIALAAELHVRLPLLGPGAIDLLGICRDARGRREPRQVVRERTAAAEAEAGVRGEPLRDLGVVGVDLDPAEPQVLHAVRRERLAITGGEPPIAALVRAIGGVVDADLRHARQHQRPVARAPRGVGR